MLFKQFRIFVISNNGVEEVLFWISGRRIARELVELKSQRPRERKERHAMANRAKIPAFRQLEHKVHRADTSVVVGCGGGCEVADGEKHE